MLSSCPLYPGRYDRLESRSSNAFSRKPRESTPSVEEKFFTRSSIARHVPPLSRHTEALSSSIIAAASSPHAYLRYSARILLCTNQSRRTINFASDTLTIEHRNSSSFRFLTSLSLVFDVGEYIVCIYVTFFFSSYFRDSEELGVHREIRDKKYIFPCYCVCMVVCVPLCGCVCVCVFFSYFPLAFSRV